MSFYTHTPGAIVITDMVIDVPELHDSVPQESDAGWDTLRETYLMRSTAATPLELVQSTIYTAQFARKVQRYNSGDTKFWVTSSSPRQLAGGLYLIDVTCAGILTKRGFKVTFDGVSQTRTVPNTTAPNEAGVATFYPKFSTRESNVTAVLEAPYIGTSPGNSTFLTSKIGKPGTLAEPITFPLDALDQSFQPVVPPSIWASLADPTYHYPNKWILESVTLENLAGLTDVYWAKYKYVYQHPQTP